MPNVDLTHQGNPVNDSKSTAPRAESNFPLSYTQMDTAQFGQLKPHFAQEVVPKDRRMSLRCSHEVDSYTLKAPLKQNISIKKDYFFVPKEAILPLQSERIITNPNIGDDVPLLTNTVVENFRKRLWSQMSAYIALITASTSTTLTASIFNYMMHVILMMRYFFSNGSLLDSLGYSNAGYVKYTETVGGKQVTLSFDKFFDKFCDLVNQHIDMFGLSTVNIEDDTPIVTGMYVYCQRSFDQNVIGYDNLNLRSFLEWSDDYPNFNITGVSFVDTSSGSTDAMTALKGLFGKISQTYNSTANGKEFNYERCAAYQLVCSHFYTNDAVDFVYEANLYRQVVQHVVDTMYARSLFSGSQDFSWNGMKLNYDSLSGQFFSMAINLVPGGTAIVSNTPRLMLVHVYYSLIFAYRRSLRFVDYFTAAKSRPLAIGDTSIPVDASNHVDVVDVTKSIQWQRFFNSVNRTGRKISEYISGLFPGNHMAPDYHNPLYLGHTSDTIYAANVENTGTAQFTQANSVSSTLKSNASMYAFEFDCDRYGVVLGIEYFDVQRMYAHSSDRQFFHTNRFDMFNPFLQFIGDQPIYREEIDDTQGSTSPFGYQLRHMEYKQRINRACGGFVESLPGWSFLADSAQGLARPRNITPEYIRSSSIELDPFYVSLTGNSYGTYFHFIIKTFNDCTSERPMVYTPQIL